MLSRLTPDVHRLREPYLDFGFGKQDRYLSLDEVLLEDYTDPVQGPNVRMILVSAEYHVAGADKGEG